MTRRRSLTAAIAFLGVIGVLLIPSAGGAATVRVRPPRTTTTTAAPVLVNDQAPTQADTPADNVGPQPVTADATLPGFQFPNFSFKGFDFPAFTFPPITVPDFVSTLIQNVLNLIRNTFCGIFGDGFCASA